jgi:membrane-bound lytic murein transglycosylase D
MKRLNMKTLSTIVGSLLLLLVGVSSAVSSTSTKKARSANLPNVQFPHQLLELPEVIANQCIAYAKKRHHIADIEAKSHAYYPMVSKILKEENVPDELKTLLPIESTFNASTVSSSGAVGFWQFLDETAKELGLQIGGKNDERRNLVKSTRAAATYLKQNYEQLHHNWYFAVAAYNCGPGNVRKAIKKSGVVNPNLNDIYVYLPSQTRNYLVKYITINVILSNYTKYINNDIEWKSYPVSTVEKYGTLDTLK